ncbi:MAG: hypothetical protein WD423_12090 [Rhodothermales bacterium]
MRGSDLNDPSNATGRGGNPTTPPSSYREITVSAIVSAIAVGIVMNAAITYAGLKIGFTIGGSAIAAVRRARPRAGIQLRQMGSVVAVRSLGGRVDGRWTSSPPGRSRLIARLAVARYARLMDRFAACERQIKRAWSAAADDNLEEARTSLKRAQPPVAAARALLDEAVE